VHGVVIVAALRQLWRHVRSEAEWRGRAFERMTDTAAAKVFLPSFDDDVVATAFAMALKEKILGEMLRPVQDNCTNMVF
jgi:hypothetical protein